jgi:predicted Zn-dependent protease
MAPRHPDASFPELAASARHLRDNPRAAASGARDFLRRYPGEPAALMLLVSAWRLAGDLRAARNILQSLARENPQLAAIQYELAVVAGELGEHGAACAAFAAVVKLEPDHPEAWRRLGDEFSELRRSHEAREAYARHLQVQVGQCGEPPQARPGE